MSQTAEDSRLTLYTTVWCGSCVRLKAQLKRENIAFTEVDIEADPGAANIVAAANNGMHLVPTVVLANGIALGNPPISAIKSHLSANA